MLFSAIFAVAGKGSLSAGIVGLSVSYALQVCLYAMIVFLDSIDITSFLKVNETF